MIVMVGRIGRATSAVAATVLALSGLPVFTETASAATSVTVFSNCRLGGLLCGRIYNDDDRYRLLITDDWGRYGDSRTWHILAPGHSSREVGVRDADGLFVGNGCTVTVAFVQHIGPGWHKVRDGQLIHVTNISCR